MAPLAAYSSRRVARSIIYEMEPQRVKIIEAYRDWKPEVSVLSSVVRLVESVPSRYLSGLDSVVLTNATALNHSMRPRKVRSQGKTVRLARCRGLYHRAWHGNEAYIELFIDNILPRKLTFAQKLSSRVHFVIDLILAGVVFHEIGHHIHTTHVPRFEEREDAAERWSRELLVAYFRKRYWYLRGPVLSAVRLVGHLLAKREQRQITHQRDPAVNT